MEYYIEDAPRQLADYDIEFFLNQERGKRRDTAAHIHTAVEMLFLKGDLLIEADGIQVEAHAGDLVLFRSNTIHSLYRYANAENHTVYYVLKLSSRFFLQNFRGGDSMACVFPFMQKQAEDRFIYRGEELSAPIQDTLQRMIKEYHHKSPTTSVIEKMYAGELIIQLYRQFFADRPSLGTVQANDRVLALIYESIDYINENYTTPIDSAICAKRVNLSYSYYAKMFRAVTGKNFTTYLSDLRLAKARDLLQTTSQSVTNVALLCGYQSPAYFTAEYRRRYGLTPRQTRKAVKGEKQA